MSTGTVSSPASPPSSRVTGAVADLDAALGRLAAALEKITDGDLHRAHRDGGWTVAEVVSHLNVCSLVWLGDLQRLRTDPDLRFFYREEVGHDLTGYPPPTVGIARGQIASTRRTLTTALAPATAEVADRTVEIPDLGTRTVEEWTPLITGHLAMHVEQAFTVMHDRGFAPEGV